MHAFAIVVTVLELAFLGQGWYFELYIEVLVFEIVNSVCNELMQNCASIIPKQSAFDKEVEIRGLLV